MQAIAVKDVTHNTRGGNLGKICKYLWLRLVIGGVVDLQEPC